jgi:transposase-like protein
MGGYGSTRWNYHRTKTTTAECLSFDIRGLPLAEYMEAEQGHSREYYWTRTRDSKRVGNMVISYRPKLSSIMFSYDIVTDSSRQPVKEIITVSKIPARYGGFQYFIHCPHCQKRRRVLYKPPQSNRFLCRECHNLTYVSSQEAHKDDRGTLLGLKLTLDLWHRYEKIQAALRGKHYGSKAYKRLMKKLNAIFAQFERVKAMPLMPPPKIRISPKYVRKRG